MGWGNYAHFTREIQGKDLTAMTVDATILTARHGTINQSERSFSTLLCQALFAKFHRKPRDHDAYRHRRTVPMSVMVFLRSVWSDPGAPPGNESNAPPGRVKVSSIKYQVLSCRHSVSIDRIMLTVLDLKT